MKCFKDHPYEVCKLYRSFYKTGVLLKCKVFGSGSTLVTMCSIFSVRLKVLVWHFIMFLNLPTLTTLCESMQHSSRLKVRWNSPHFYSSAVKTYSVEHNIYCYKRSQERPSFKHQFQVQQLKLARLALTKQIFLVKILVLRSSG